MLAALVWNCMCLYLLMIHPQGYERYKSIQHATRHKIGHSVAGLFSCVFRITAPCFCVPLQLNVNANLLPG